MIAMLVLLEDRKLRWLSWQYVRKRFHENQYIYLKVIKGRKLTNQTGIITREAYLCSKQS
jgi:hypothetical protein